MKHLATIVMGLALAVFGGWLIVVNRHGLTTPLLGGGFGSIAVGFALVIPAQFAAAAQAAGAGLKAVVGACGCGKSDGGTP